MINILKFILIGFLMFPVASCNAEEEKKSKQLLSLPFLVVDLDGDGIELIPLEESNVYFDVDGDGLAERTAWVKPDDGFLLIISRDDTHEPSLSKQVVLFSTGGLRKLKIFDKNTDQKYTSVDKISFLDKDVLPLELTLWQDSNANGYPDDDELIQHIQNKSQNFILSYSEGMFLEHNSISHNFSELKFEYEDTNNVWTSSCDQLSQDGYVNTIVGVRSAIYTAHKECLDNGYIPNISNMPKHVKEAFEKYQKEE